MSSAAWHGGHGHGAYAQDEEDHKIRKGEQAAMMKAECDKGVHLLGVRDSNNRASAAVFTMRIHPLMLALLLQ